jgi:hypothetical protein
MPVARVEAPKPPSIEYWGLPMLPSPLLDSTSARGAERRSAKKRLEETIEEVRFIASSESPAIHTQPVAESPGSLLLTRSVALDEKLPVAKILVNSSTLEFKWEDSTHLADLVPLIEDSALRIRGQGQHEHIVFLRDLKIAKHEALSITLTPEEARGVDLRRKRTRSIPWCDTKALETSSWEPVIRRWQIHSQRANDPKPEVIADGTREDAEYELIPERRATLGIKIPREKPARHQIELSLNVDYEQMNRDRARASEIPKELRETKQKLDRLGKRESLDKEEGERHDELSRHREALKREESDLRRYLDLFEHIYVSRSCSLSIIIGVKIGHEVLDLARFGTIEESVK